MEINPAELEVVERYKLLIGTIVPRPIAFVSTVSPEGVPNLAPFSFFNGVGSNPMMVMFCPANNTDGTEKDTLRNAKPESEGGTGQFVVNLAVENYIRQVAAAADAYAPEVSEFDEIGLTAAPSKTVMPPRVAESPVAIECETTQVIRTNGDAPAGGNIVLGRVTHVFVRDDLINERFHTEQEALRAVGRMGGLRYATTREQFDLPPKREALDLPDPLG
ncbi:MAG: flavin reductase family protein [Phycisphaerales bacterium]